jgi:hypothetical protein
MEDCFCGHKWPLFHQHSRGGCGTQAFRPKHNRDDNNLAARKVNGFWVAACQDVLISEQTLAENPIDCRIFFADNARRKTESGIGGKNP